MTNNKTAIHITKEASNTQIEDCEFVGFDTAIKNEGKETKVIRSIFHGIKLTLPKSIFGRILTSVIATVIAGIILWLLSIN